MKDRNKFIPFALEKRENMEEEIYGSWAHFTLVLVPTLEKSLQKPRQGMKLRWENVKMIQYPFSKEVKGIWNPNFSKMQD